MLTWQRLVLFVVGLGIGGGVVSPGAAPAENPGPRQRLLWDRGEIQGTVTADGQWLSFPNWHTGDLGVRNLVTGESHLVTHRGGYFKAQGKTEDTAMSPDGRWIAFKWERWDAGAAAEGKYPIRVIGADGRGERVVLSG